jgi:polygalacturonase
VARLRERMSATEGVFEVTRFGAVGDGKTPATAAIQRAIEACAAAGGGVVHVPPGRFLCGALFLRSHLRLCLSAGSTLVTSQRPADFPPLPSRWEGIERTTHASLLNGDGLEDVSVEGPGAIDGAGGPWWKAHEETKQLRLALDLPREAENPPHAPLRWPRPRAITLIRCRQVRVSNLSITDAPSYNLHLIYSQDVWVNGLTIVGLEGQNSDGIQVDSCQRVVIANCSIASGGESIALKSGYNEDGRRVGIACEDVLVTNCNLSQSHGAAFACGSETAAWIRNVTLTNCTISHCRLGLHMRSPRGRGGGIERVLCSDLVLDRIRETGVVLTHYFDSVRMDNLFGEPVASGGNPETDRSLKVAAGDGTPTFRDIQFRRLTFGAVREVAVIEGLPERFIEGLVLEDVWAPAAHTGVLCARVNGLEIDGLAVEASDGPAVAARDIRGLRVHRMRTTGRAGKAAIQLDNVDGAFIQGCDTQEGELVGLHGVKNRGVVLKNNRGAERLSVVSRAGGRPGR